MRDLNERFGREIRTRDLNERLKAYLIAARLLDRIVSTEASSAGRSNTYHFRGLSPLPSLLDAAKVRLISTSACLKDSRVH